MGHSPWSYKELDMTERLSTAHYNVKYTYHCPSYKTFRIYHTDTLTNALCHMYICVCVCSVLLFGKGKHIH